VFAPLSNWAIADTDLGTDHSLRSHLFAILHLPMRSTGDAAHPYHAFRKASTMGDLARRMLHNDQPDEQACLSDH
jgi:GH25 family lysozyme M1 (1,4-beta-N-acetylmuramidase)